MSEIKERAIAKYCTHCGARTEYNCFCHATPCNRIKNYIIIAKEQKAADTEKAKEAFNKACGWLAVYPWFNGVFEEFVKATEEE